MVVEDRMARVTSADDSAGDSAAVVAAAGAAVMTDWGEVAASPQADGDCCEAVVMESAAWDNQEAVGNGRTSE